MKRASIVIGFVLSVVAVIIVTAHRVVRTSFVQTALGQTATPADRLGFGVPSAGTMANHTGAMRSAGAGGGAAWYTFTATSNGSGAFTCVLPPILGPALYGQIVNGTSGDQPSNGYAITLTDNASGAIYSFSGLSNAVDNTLEMSASNPIPGFFTGAVTISATGLGAAKKITIRLFARS